MKKSKNEKNIKTSERFSTDENVNISNMAAAAADWATVLRRELHRMPELGNKELLTCEMIKTALEELGIPYTRMLETGITADIRGTCRGGIDRGKTTVALRAEMDALPITEETGLVFSSGCEGRMHACGHDVHMAVLLGTAQVLKKLETRFSGTVRLIFQPAEETVGGACRMMECGCLDGVDAVIGLHVRPNLPAGTIGIKRGSLHPSSLMFRMKVEGKGCHGAYPNQGIDAVVIAAQIVANSQAILARNFNPLEAGLITFGKIEGGNARNVIADEVELLGIIRAFGREELTFLKNRLVQVAEFTAQGQGGSIVHEFEEGYPELVNDEGVIAKIETALLRESTVELVQLEGPTMGVDDFACFAEKVPGAMCFLGAGFSNKNNKQADIAQADVKTHSGEKEPCNGEVSPYRLHSKNLIINEECIKTGILAETLAVLEFLKG